MFFNKIFDLLVSTVSFVRLFGGKHVHVALHKYSKTPSYKLYKDPFFPQKYMYMYLQGPFISMFMVPIMNMYLSSILVEYNNTILLTSLGDT